MKNSFLFLFFIGLSWSQGVVGEDEHLAKKSAYPYMAFIYYTDPTVVDAAGARFIRSAVLIRDDWLATAALGPSVSDTYGFPKKTLLARVGAISIDSNFTLNEDEDEQEREVIQIIRPYNHSATQWWTTDISLMKTLLPFNTTAAVAPISINKKMPSSENKNCIILIYARRNANNTDEKALMQLFVDVQSSSMENCGIHFSASTMVCAIDTDENKDMFDTNICQGNSGGPLICEGEVVGLQTYIDNNCKQPHLYQLLSSWDNFITCGIEAKCYEEQCLKICDVTYKDPPKINSTIHDAIVLASAPPSTEITTNTTVSETMSPEEDLTETTTVLFATEIKHRAIKISTTIETLTPTLTHHSYETTENIPWPKEKVDDWKNDEEEERKANVEAQLEGRKKERSASERNMCLVQTVVFGLVLCLF